MRAIPRPDAVIRSKGVISNAPGRQYTGVKIVLIFRQRYDRLVTQVPEPEIGFSGQRQAIREGSNQRAAGQLNQIGSTSDILEESIGVANSLGEVFGAFATFWQ